MASRRVAAIAGATGLVGRHLTELLLESSRHAGVLAVGRRAPTVTHQKLTVIPSDLQAIPSLTAIDDAFCCLGTTIKNAGSQAAFRAVDFDMVLNFAKAAKLGGAKRFLVVSSLGANAKSPVFYNRVKGEMEQALMRMEFKSLTILRPSFLLGDRAETRAGEKIGIAMFSALAPLMIGPARKVRPVRAKDVAKAMLTIAGSEALGTMVLESDQIIRDGYF